MAWRMAGGPHQHDGGDRLHSPNCSKGKEAAKCRQPECSPDPSNDQRGERPWPQRAASAVVNGQTDD
jgi:hypothetical protein